ncbi:hypothetical protein G7K_5889-t1 [Saitoella complicata NRRL Y-17804]|uniref:Alpha-1,6-mannosyltransferase n=2 Tax=Saitoella complicata (strain BCRC 22490 / CBS 7301 / JCM 7358 / NBRC 10748 / NRRL Y-17804) TaxID=698492 RepID=A0A0E9NPR3_SAICN|nr:hypothetical protein G7K_5889-t1 [Saitoella complicata NRRL Y-17804]
MPPQRRIIVFIAALLTLVFFFWPTHGPRPTIHNPPQSSQAKGDVQQQDESYLGSTKAGIAANPDSASSADTRTFTYPSYLRSGEPLRTAIAAEFKYDPNAKWPRYIWQTWKVSPSSGEFPERFRYPEATWTEKHRYWVHEVITDAEAPLLLEHLYKGLPMVLEAYWAMPHPILKADFFRYLILLARGGVYSDIDTEALQPAESWLTEELDKGVGLVVGIEADPDREDWAEWYSRRIQFCQWTIMGKRGHPVLGEIVARITEKTLKLKAQGQDALVKEWKNSVVEWTGPAAWTDAVFDHLDPALPPSEAWKPFAALPDRKKVGDVVVLPITAFSPGMGHMGSKDVGDAMAMVKHEFEGSWKPEEERMKEGE